MSTKLKTFFTIFSVLAISSTWAGDQRAKAAKPIFVGAVLPLSGDIAALGQTAKYGMDLALEEINRSGGFKGQQIKIDYQDSKGLPQDAATVSKLLAFKKPIALLGDINSSNSLQVAAAAEEFKIPHITPSATNPEVTKIGSYSFRTCFIDPFQGAVMAKFVREDLKLNRAAIFQDVKSDYSVGLSQYFRETFTRLGGTIVQGGISKIRFDRLKTTADFGQMIRNIILLPVTGGFVWEQVYYSSDGDFRAQLTWLKARKPEFIFIPGSFMEVGLILRQAKELDIKAVIGGGDGWDSVKLYEIAGDSVDKTYYSSHFSPDDQTNPIVREFVQKYEAQFHSVPDSPAALGYDSVMMLLDSMKRAKSLAGTDLRDAIASTTNFEGVTGNISIDKDHNAKKPAVIFEFQADGSRRFVKRVVP